MAEAQQTLQRLSEEYRKLQEGLWYEICQLGAKIG